jgi:hypothetical protein
MSVLNGPVSNKGVPTVCCYLDWIKVILFLFPITRHYYSMIIEHLIKVKDSAQPCTCILLLNPHNSLLRQ